MQSSPNHGIPKGQKPHTVTQGGCALCGSARTQGPCQPFNHLSFLTQNACDWSDIVQRSFFGLTFRLQNQTAGALEGGRHSQKSQDLHGINYQSTSFKLCPWAQFWTRSLTWKATEPSILMRIAIITQSDSLKMTK